jgi:hypothetical protein
MKPLTTAATPRVLDGLSGKTAAQSLAIYRSSDPPDAN